MISSSPALLEMREKFEKNKSSLTDVFRTKPKNFIETNDNNNNSPNNKEWLEKLDNDINTLNKDQSYFIMGDKQREMEKKTNNHTSTIMSRREKERRDYTTDKELDTIIHNFHKAADDKNYRSFTEKKKTNSVKKTKSVSRRNSKQAEERSNLNHSGITNKSSTAANKVSYEHINNLNKEIEHLKNFCKELKISHEENCIMKNEKKHFDKIKNDHIKVNADVNIMKEDIKEIFSNYQQVIKRLNALEEENNSLRQHNKNLIKFIQGNETKTMTYQSFHGGNNEKILRNINIIDEETARGSARANMIQVENSTPLSELSAFNTVHNQSSMEMNYNINNNLDHGKKRRFLIPKIEDINSHYN